MKKLAKTIWHILAIIFAVAIIIATVNTCS
jgi:hypothetical protein